jgi:hypothetical protein
MFLPFFGGPSRGPFLVEGVFLPVKTRLKRDLLQKFPNLPDFTRNAKKRSSRFGPPRVNLQNIEIFHLVQGKLLVFEQLTLLKWLLCRYPLRPGPVFVTNMEVLR